MPSEMPYSIHGYCTRWQIMTNLQETCVLLESQVDPVKGTCQCIRCSYLSGPEAGHLEVFLDFTDCTA